MGGTPKYSEMLDTLIPRAFLKQMRGPGVQLSYDKKVLELMGWMAAFEMQAGRQYRRSNALIKR
jgi:hypothetical protein